MTTFTQKMQNLVNENMRKHKAGTPALTEVQLAKIDDVVAQVVESSYAEIEEVIEERKRPDWGGCYECGNESYNQALEELREALQAKINEHE